MDFSYDIDRFFGRMNTYRNREYAITVAQRTGGEFVDKEYTDDLGSYWVVLWR